jgi:hypothetical protein
MFLPKWRIRLTRQVKLGEVGEISPEFAWQILAERGGFEPPIPKGDTRFRGVRH